MVTFERAELASFGYRQARHTGSLDCIKAICYVIRNRVLAGWSNGSYLAVITQHELAAGNEDSETWTPKLDVEDRVLQMIVRDIDDVYFGTSDDQVKRVVQDALYYQFIDKPIREWFTDHILMNSKDHPRIAGVGTILFFR
jgi:hypothetical protein